MNNVVPSRHKQNYTSGCCEYPHNDYGNNNLDSFRFFLGATFPRRNDDLRSYREISRSVEGKVWGVDIRAMNRDGEGLGVIVLVSEGDGTVQIEPAVRTVTRLLTLQASSISMEELMFK